MIQQNLVKFYCTSCDNKIEAYSTVESDVVRVEMCFFCHPFYTKGQFSDIKTGRVERFNRREKKTEQTKNKK